MVVSAISEVVDKVLLLELGADDYVTKPFSPRELMARVQAAIRRRRRPTTSSTYRFADCEVDFKKMTVTRGGQVVTLTSHEFKLLKFFTDNAERVLSREELLNEVWGYNCYPNHANRRQPDAETPPEARARSREPALSPDDLRRRIQVRSISK